jgi:acyl-CoA dehydrogenase
VTAVPDIDEGRKIAARVEAFVRAKVLPFENDRRWLPHGPTEELVTELRALALKSRVLTPHITSDFRHLSFQATALVFHAAGLSPLGPIALNVAAPDEGNMYLLDKIATASQKQIFLEPLLSGAVRSAFFMTEPAGAGGAGSDPSMMQTTATRMEDHWLIKGQKAFITGAQGASVGIIMAKTDSFATMFVVPLPDPAVCIERVYDTLDGSMPGGHALVSIDGLRVSSEQILGELNEGFRYAQIRLAPARLTHCMRWLGAARRCQEIATDYAIRRRAFGKVLIDHEGVGFMLADNLIDLKQSELLIGWCAGVLDEGNRGTLESSMTKVAVSEALYRVVDRCVQIMGATGVSDETVVAQVFREIRSFRIYDGPTEVHKWSIANAIKKRAQPFDAPITRKTNEL